MKKQKFLFWLTTADLRGRSLIISFIKSINQQPNLRGKTHYLYYFCKWQYYRLFLLTDEFHHSLNLNVYLLSSDDLLRDFYIEDIMSRRYRAHKRYHEKKKPLSNLKPT